MGTIENKPESESARRKREAREASAAAKMVAAEQPKVDAAPSEPKVDTAPVAPTQRDLLLTIMNAPNGVEYIIRCIESHRERVATERKAPAGKVKIALPSRRMKACLDPRMPAVGAIVKHTFSRAVGIPEYAQCRAEVVLDSEGVKCFKVLGLFAATLDSQGNVIPSDVRALPTHPLNVNAGKLLDSPSGIQEMVDCSTNGWAFFGLNYAPAPVAAPVAIATVAPSPPVTDAAIASPTLP